MHLCGFFVGKLPSPAHPALSCSRSRQASNVQAGHDQFPSMRSGWQEEEGLRGSWLGVGGLVCTRLHVIDSVQKLVEDHIIQVTCVNPLMETHASTDTCSGKIFYEDSCQCT